MQNITTHLTKLLSQEAEDLKDNEYYYSSYIPKNKFSKLGLKRRIKSQFITSLRDHPDLAKMSDLHQTIARQLLSEYDGLEDIKQGVACFVRFDKEEAENTDITLIELALPPKQESHLGKTFDLDQLIWIKNNTDLTLVINLTRDESSFYELVGREIKLINVRANEFKDSDVNEYIEKHAPIRNQETYYSTGADKVDKQNTQENIYFIAEITQYLKNELEEHKDYRYIIVFYTANYQEIINKFQSRIDNLFPESSLIFVDKNISDENKLKTESIKRLTSFQKNIKKDILNLAKEDHQKFVSGWYDVAKADRLKKIDTLFIKPKVSQKGYIYNKEYIYTHPAKDSRQVENIAPWLVKNVAETSGKVVVIKNEDLMPNADISARLRYV